MNQVARYVKSDPKKRTRLRTIKNRLDTSLKSVRDFISDAIRDLFIIENEKLFYYDNCDCMREFIEKNAYPQKLSLKYTTITARLKVERYIEENGFGDSVRSIGYGKLLPMATFNITKEKDVLRLSQFSQNELRHKLYSKRMKETGRFIKKGYSRREGTEVVIWDLEIPNKTRKKFETGFRRLCKEHGVTKI